MSAETVSYTQWHLRHGSSTGNEGEDFQGGGPDDLPGRGPVVLTATGERQAVGAGAAGGKIGLRVEHVVTSEMARARRTGRLFVAAYTSHLAAPVEYSPLPNFQEITHGVLERTPGISREAAADHAAMSREAMTEAFTEAGITPSPEHIGWVSPNGAGDGESYLEAGIRAYTAIDGHSPAPNTLFVGHNGAMRQARGLGIALNRAQRAELAGVAGDFFDSQLEIRSLARDIVEQNGHLPTKEELVNIFRLGVQAAGRVVDFLAAHEVPQIDRMIGKRRRIGNGQIIQIGVQSDGRWELQWRLNPILPDDPDTPITKENVKVDALPFTPES